MYTALRMCAKTKSGGRNCIEKSVPGPAQAYTALVMLVELVTIAPYSLLGISRVLGSALLLGWYKVVLMLKFEL